jgi:tRNA-specific 2-thiouridylase
MKTVFVAMSGGIDSSYSAYLLKEEGYKVVGFTFDLLPSSLRNERNRKMCCSAVSVDRAKNVAGRLAIPHYVLNMREAFEQHVIRRFVEEYGMGRTPNPCVLCNRYIKFDLFLRKAAAMGADLVATGHYARIGETARGFALKKGADGTKDQSYFLYPIQRDDLKMIDFPLAATTKETVRQMFGVLGQAAVPESQDICFIPDNDYRAFVRQFIPQRKGPVILSDGRQIGDHEGVHLYTIGQRRGINIPFKEPLYVVELRARDNVVVVGGKDALARIGLRADDINMLSSAVEGEARAKVRYRQKEEKCSYAVRDGLLEIVFDEPISSITPGQSVVLYDGETVLGGGTIRETFA